MGYLFIYRCDYCDNETDDYVKTEDWSKYDSSDKQCDCGNFLKNKRMIIGINPESASNKSGHSMNFTPVVHEYFDESLGEVVKGRNHIKQICREKKKRYLSLSESDQEYNHLQKHQKSEMNRRDKEFSDRFLTALYR